MTLTAYLRVYQPLAQFSEEESERWLALPENDDTLEQTNSSRWLISSALPAYAITEGAFVRKIEGRIVVCPWRTRLRMLSGLLAFRTSLPDEVADAFVPAHDAVRAARELAELERKEPRVRSQILHANWHVPLRWFSAFDDSERILTEDRRGLRIRYETSLSVARERLDRTLEILRSSWIDDDIVVALQDLVTWLEGFSDEGLLELDYGTVANTFPDEELLEDHSAAEVWACLEAMEAGDVMKAGRTFSKLSERWTEVRAREVVN